QTEDEHLGQAGVLFENFVQASTCKGTLQAFSILCRQLELDPLDYSNFYSCLKAAVSTWKVKPLWTKLDKRAQQKVYSQNKACQGTRCLIIGSGPCGLRTAIELALLGCKVVVIEKRDTFSRNNVLHLWPFTIHDLRGLGAKKFYGKFCAGSIDHISIRQLQLMLLKVCLILGVEIHVNVEFTGLAEPPKEPSDVGSGWRAELQPSNHPVSDFHFDVVIGADGRKSTLDGFTRKEFRGKLAIAITANFVNRNTTAEAKVEEISGVAFIFNQKFFLELKEETGIDLENIVYYRDNTHYFVMTAKKQSLLDKGVIINKKKDHMETERLLSVDNINHEALLSYAREAADFGTNYQLPSLDYAINHYGQPDVAMFDFTCMYASENAALIREKHGHQLVVALVGDSLLEPFWPMGTGCARGFLAAFDTAWMVKGWAQGRKPHEILAERESIYRLLPQTTPDNISKNFEQYSIDPATRYPNLNVNYIRPHQVRHLFISGQMGSCHLGRGGLARRSVSLIKRESDVRPGRLLTWCQKQTQGYRGVAVTNLTSSWRSGLALCALIHHQRPDLIDFDSLSEEDVAENNQLAFDVAEREFGIQPVIRGEEMAAQAEPDQLLTVFYLSKFYEAFRISPGNGSGQVFYPTSGSPASAVLSQRFFRSPCRRGRRAAREQDDEDPDPSFSDPPSRSTTPYSSEEEGLGGSDTCHFCSKRVYVMERLSAEGHFFHRECFRCDACGCSLRLGGHAFDSREAKFYCKMHYAQRQSRGHMGGSRGTVPSLDTNGSCSAGDGVQTQPPGTSLSPLTLTPTAAARSAPRGLFQSASEPFHLCAVPRLPERAGQPVIPPPHLCSPLLVESFPHSSACFIILVKGPRPPNKVRGGTRLVDDPEAATQDASRLAGPHPTAAQSQIQERSLPGGQNAAPSADRGLCRRARREQLKRLHRAQAIQRQLEEVAEKQRNLEERGVAVEKSIRRETGADDFEEAQLYQTWFELVLEKNRLTRYESELMIFAQELELEDTQSRLQQDLRQRMATDDTKKSASELQEEQQILSEIMRTVEKRDALVSVLEEQRLKERAE
uniref:F-actin monooxygenase n=1 Tax=Tetraodon nigroviridis TaxID=99883 RepID=H3CTX6_TETNG